MMSSLVIQERDALIRLLEDCLGDLVQIVTADEQKARPLPNKVAVFIEPPELAYKKWGNEPDITWRLDIIAGTMATQAPRWNSSCGPSTSWPNTSSTSRRHGP